MKKFICSLLILSLALFVLTAGYAQEETDIETLRAADVNSDGIIDILDLVSIASHFGETVAEDQTPNPDVNRDGSINILDLVLVASHFGATVKPPVALVATDPENGSEITTEDAITLTFDNPPEAVTTNTGVVTTDGNSATITGPFTPGAVALTITWADGTKTLLYAVRPFVTFVDAKPENGSEITTEDAITLTFDNPPEAVTANTGVVTTDGNSATVSGPFTPGTLALTITWEDGTETLSYTIRPLSAFVSAEPESGTEITTKDNITLTFDNPPEDVSVSTGVATIDGNSVTITGPFTPGDLALTVTWADGTETLSYPVRPFVAFVGTDPENGTEITTNDSITLTFDNPPADVTVSTGVALTDGNTVTITGPFTPGDLKLTITWEDGTEALSYTVRRLVALASFDPTIDSVLTIDSSIILKFDNPPQDVTVSTGVATVDGNTVTIKGPFTPGDLELTITWSDGSLPLTYTVVEPDTEAPSITSGTVSDGDTGVDPNTTIEIVFSEEVTGTIILQTEAGEDVGWTVTVEGDTATLELVAGKALEPETKYVIAGTVEDAAGNETDINIAFTTASTYDGIPIEVTDANFDSIVLDSKLPVVVESYKDG